MHPRTSCNHASFILFGVALALLTRNALAAEPTAVTHDLAPTDTLERFEAPPVDLQAVAIEDEQRELNGLPPRFAIRNPVYYTPDADGTWERVDNQTQVWRMVIASPGAAHLNLGFTRYVMPRGARLMIYASDMSSAYRPFTDYDNSEAAQLWTPVLLSDEMIVEVTVPDAVADQLELELEWVNVGYRGFGAVNPAAAMSGSCNVDVVCAEGDDWRLDIPSVAVIGTNGSTFCTGFMVNNTAQDLAPFFMTAAHCGINAGNAPTLWAYWNYENSWCRPPGGGPSGGPGDGSLAQFNTGAVFKASYSPSDMTLVRLNNDPDPAWNVSYAGWSNDPGDALQAIAIHHPNTDEKRISFEYQPTTTTSYLGNPVPGDGTHVRVEDWDVGTTEPGSSGSPLFDQNHRIIGQLHGGYASCTSQTSDWYGKFSVSWTGGGSNSSRLSNWLDPLGTGAVTTDTISLATLCSSAGEVNLDSPKYGCEGTAGVQVIDCDLNLDDAVIDSATATVSSGTEPAGEAVTLTETAPNSGRFEGSIALSATNAAGIVQVTAGDTLTASYLDADDGSGGMNITVTATADTDCTAPVISNVQVTDVQPRSATMQFNTDEPSVGTIRYGLACGTLTGSESGSGFSTTPLVEVTGLQDATTYFFAVDATDEAGNVGSDDNGGACYTFTTPDIPNFFTEQFDGGNDLDNWSLIFTPNGSFDYYAGCAETITALPTDPTGGTTLSLSDDSSAVMNFTGGQTVSFYGTAYAAAYAGSNGYVTFGGGDTDYSESLTEHFSMPRISGVYDDLNPTAGGTVSWKQLADRVAITYLNVAEYSTSNSNTFQVELFFDGKIVVSYLAIAVTDGIAGLSAGDGLSPDFFENDLSNSGACGPPDCNGNGTPDDQDIADCAGDPACGDCNGNGVPDGCDLGGTSADCNGNSIPDECDTADGTEPDCNNNSVPDDCDITSGASEDCNGNAAPDECDVADGTEPDCNSNGVPDGCDITAGSSQDCNGNGAPDECDIAGCGGFPACSDCNGNGVPDGCDISGGAADDCDANGIPDSCDLASCGGAPGCSDCNGNAIQDGCDIAGGASSDDNGNSVPDECDISGPLVVGSGSRYLGVTPLPAELTLPVAVLITGDAGDPDVACVSAYLQADGSLGAGAVYQTPATWGTLYAYGEQILPGTTYTVSAELAGGARSTSGSGTTYPWGDINNNGLVNFTDINLTVQGFQGNFVETTLEATDLEPCVPNGNVNFADIDMTVKAFQGEGYAITSCPVPCN